MKIISCAWNILILNYFYFNVVFLLTCYELLLLPYILSFYSKKFHFLISLSAKEHSLTKVKIFLFLSRSI